jgi:hypothetical protein
LEKYRKLFSNCWKSTFLTLTLRFHALVNSGIKIFGFGSEKWISLVGKKLPYLSNSYIDENSYFFTGQYFSAGVGKQKISPGKSSFYDTKYIYSYFSLDDIFQQTE